MNTLQVTEDHLEEYKMIREEIMTYMDKFQTVRNKMFVAIAAMMALAYTKENAHPLTAFLPILFILSSYSCATNYCIAVRKATAYLVIYHESSPSYLFRWDSRHNMFKNQESWPWIFRMLEGKGRERRSVASDITSQLYAFYTCSATTMSLFAIKVWQPIPTETGYNGLSWKIMVGGFSLRAYLIIGIVLVIVQVCSFYRSSLGLTYKEFSDLFIRIKTKEKLTPQGMCWKEDAEKIGYYTYDEKSKKWNFVEETRK